MGSVYHAFRDGGVDCAIRYFDWDTPVWAEQLGNYPRNRTRAAYIASEIAAFHQRQPHAPIYIVGYSAGGGLAVFICEALPADVYARRVVLVQGAISPTYDLTTALEHVDDRLVSLHVPSDILILGLLTSLYGNIDRSFESAAGRLGFNADRAVPRAAQRAKLTQITWTPEMIWSGHLGDHRSLFAYGFNRKYVAPWLSGAGPAPE